MNGLLLLSNAQSVGRYWVKEMTLREHLIRLSKKEYPGSPDPPSITICTRDYSKTKVQILEVGEDCATVFDTFMRETWILSIDYIVGISEGKEN